MRVLVCGSRDFTDEDIIFTILDGIYRRHGAPEIIEGGAPGADTIAAEWAGSSGLVLHHFPADWEQYGKAAGPIRNKQMLVEGKPDLVLAFVNKSLLDSRGTANMVGLARMAGVKTYVIEGDNYMEAPDFT